MAAVLTCARAELRARRRAWGVVAVVIGLAGGVVLTTAAGARRTDTAYPRLLRASRGAHALVAPFVAPDDPGLSRFFADVAALPQVAVAERVIGLTAADPQRKVPVQMLGGTDARFGRAIERPKITAGRMFRPERAGEAVADTALARQLHLHPGSVVNLLVGPSNAAGFDFARAQPLTLRIVGVGVTRDNVVPVNALAAHPLLVVTPALIQNLNPGPDLISYTGSFVRLRPGETVPAFTPKAQELAARNIPDGGPLFVADENEQAAKVEQAIRPQAVALALFAGLAAVTALLVVGQLLSRQLFLAATEHPTLRALGMSRAQLFSLGLGEAAAAAAVGAVLAVAAAAAASPLMPIGPARIAEPHPGLALNWAVLGLGGAAIVVLLVLRVAWPAWTLAAQRAGAEGTVDVRGAERPSRIAATVGRTGAPVSAAVGVRLALEPGRGRTAVPVRSAFVGTGLAVAAVAAAFTFGTNLVRLVDTPRLYGQTWDVAVDSQFATIPPAQIEGFLGQQRGVSGWTFGDHATLRIAGHDVHAIALASGRGPVMFPSVLEGRAPAIPDEIVLGTKTLEAAHRRVGQTVSVLAQGETEARTMRVVGRAVFPFFGQGGFTPTGLGEGAAMLNPAPNPDGFNFFLLRMQPGPGKQAAIASLAGHLQAPGPCPADQDCGAITAQRPGDVRNYARIQRTPLVLAGLLALLAMATVAHLLVTSIRRRRRDLAVLKTLGFLRRQVSATVAWQATVLVTLALLVGLPVGVAAGRGAWQVFAGRLGVAPDPSVPLVPLALSIPVVLVAANAVAAGPGWVAGRLRPAPVLRAE